MSHTQMHGGAEADDVGHAGPLRLVLDAVETGTPLDPVVARWLAAAPWVRRAGRAQRDALIRQLAGAFAGSTNARALQVQAELRDYGSRKWPLDRRCGAPYPHSARREMLFRLFGIDDDPPTSSRQLFTIITGDDCNTDPVPIASLDG